MLLALLYHKSGKGRYANPLSLLEAHFAHIASHYKTLLPGEPLRKGLSLCLTFDDAFCDFYYLIFPLLKKYQLKALLAVPISCILERAPLPREVRLRQAATFPEGAPFLPSAAFCSWEELQELADSPLIEIASHSLSHRPLTAPHVEVERELVASKRELEKRLKRPISSFVYPFGAWSRQVHQVAKGIYRYLFRIGGACNFSWESQSRVLYRICSDQLKTPTAPFGRATQLKSAARFFFNRMRRK